MGITALKIVVLLCFLIIPFRGPSKRRKTGYKRPEKTVISSNYGINEYGELEDLITQNKG
jgi:hypothetical protein